VLSICSQTRRSLSTGFSLSRRVEGVILQSCFWCRIRYRGIRRLHTPTKPSSTGLQQTAM